MKGKQAVYSVRLKTKSCCFDGEENVFNDTSSGKCDILNITWEFQRKQQPTGPFLRSLSSVFSFMFVSFCRVLFCRLFYFYFLPFA